ncbi:unnamed protein product [Caenorhabditis sp. 36 PRJEB53466]|nr:unnamed protein product [Caenorhabditis sp. 36 PRJEB53466]
MNLPLVLIFCLISGARAYSLDETVDCARTAFKDTISELSEFSDFQLESFQNISPETKKKLKVTMMDVLSSLGLLLELSTAPSVSLATLPLFIVRAKTLMALLERDMDNLKPETEHLSSTVQPIIDKVRAVVNGLPMKTVECFKSVNKR